MRIALATCTDLPHLDGDEEPLVAALRARAIDVVMPAWDQGDAPFLASDLTVIRSTWDYTTKLDAFIAWAQRLEDQGACVQNKASVVRWNTHKRYLQTLADEGIPVVPTVHTQAGARIDVKAMLKERDWTRGAVIKPAVSAGSRDTVRVHGLATEEAQALADALAPTRDLMIQPFVDGIAHGELSLHFVDGAFTHAVNKVPKGEDFRSQPEFGSQVTRVEPDAHARHIAKSALATTGGNLLYGRVDLVPANADATDGPWWLIELELVEPSMYLRFDERAAETFADAIVRRASERRRA
jgi:glutathione synthase/RimK-type ligase-like ATP-grasp enzyme